jgi:hypothetical protein
MESDGIIAISLERRPAFVAYQAARVFKRLPAELAKRRIEEIQNSGKDLIEKGGRD